MGPLFLFAIFHSFILISPSSALCVPRNNTSTGRRPVQAPPPPPPPRAVVVPSLPPARSPPPVDRSASLKAICSRTDNPVLCDNMLTSYLEGASSITPRSVLEAHMTACSDHTSKAAAFVTTLIANPLTLPIMSASLGVCKDNYADAQDNIDQARAALVAGDKSTVNIMMSAAMSDYETCEDGFMELPGVRSPIASFNDMLSKIGSNCLAIAEMV